LEWEGKHKQVRTERHWVTQDTYTSEEYKELKETNLLMPDGVNVKRITMHGPLSRLNIF
jgi:hypothetical protein